MEGSVWDRDREAKRTLLFEEEVVEGEDLALLFVFKIDENNQEVKGGDCCG